ncbi:hypothetical protein EOJ32_19145 (plasmid) [Paracoccus sp. Arc7-R13]|uniref:hypothetical protein n=1 Tax=Paracoccus sp. Arc7-R13 TaxID=2500532 RepID=UPI000FDBA7C4|nr:hypothetical protein [Paracoccus sp. Arc7-R13]AZY95911.1 hypothetical protein EOJ32_19145 [Paracoccus sp. Arc7-R13]
MKAFVTASVFAFSAAPAFAWVQQTDFRGLEIFDYEAGAVDLQIICDPQGAFVPPIFSATISLDGVDYEGDLTFRSSAGTFNARAMNGGISGNDRDSWTNMINAFRSSAQIELDAGGRTYHLDTSDPLSVPCGIEI